MTLLEDTVMAAPAGDVSARVIEREAVAHQPVAEVWRLWATHEGVTDWLVRDARVELTIGGAYEFYFLPDTAVGSRGGEGCRVLSYLPERMLSFTWNAPPSFPAERRKRTWVVLQFESEGAARTRVRLTHLGWPESGWRDGGHWPQEYAYFEDAWTNVMAALQAHCARAHDSDATT